MKRISFKPAVFVFIIALFAGAVAVQAQQATLNVQQIGNQAAENSGTTGQPPAIGAEEPKKRAVVMVALDPDSDQNLDPSEIPSMMFNVFEHQLIREAREDRGKVRPTTETEIERETETLPEEVKPKPPPEERYISLSGILFNSSEDWIIWMNGKRITPQALPTEVLDLRVAREYIEFKWFDDYTNQIFPIRLRPNQRFNIDTRIFLPG